MSDTDKSTVEGGRRKPFTNGDDGRAESQEEASGQEPAEQRQEAREEAAPPQEDPEVVRLRAELEASRKRVDELARAFQSMNQDREDFKARLTRERERLIDVERGNVALTLLEAIDELDRSLNASASDDSPLARGVRLIRDGLLAKLTQTGIERVPLVGKPFDPNVAEAADMEITTVPEDDQKVVAELQGGYKLKDRVIRPGRVKVAKYVKPASA
jgi:molecular chaperone GrpE